MAGRDLNSRLCNFRDWALPIKSQQLYPGADKGPAVMSYMAEMGLWAPIAMLDTCHQHTIFYPGTRNGGYSLLVFLLNGVGNPSLSTKHNPNRVTINTTPRLLPQKSFDLICEELPVIDLTALRHPVLCLPSCPLQVKQG